jgi:hypothetical protein
VSEKRKNHTHPHTPDSAKNLAAEPLIANRLIHMKEKKRHCQKMPYPYHQKKSASALPSMQHKTA